jgi:iron(III) transport system ATP-binding protein
MVTIAIEHVTKRFPAAKTDGKSGGDAAAGGSGAGGMTTAVDDVSLTIPSGALFFLLGPSGCGKTTLLRMIAGFILPTEGRITFDGKDMTYVPPHERDTGMVFQSYALWPHMTVGDNVGFGLDVRKIKGAEREKRIDEALGLVQMGHLKGRKPNQLSGGQQQRVALARALAFRPQCLLLDEPLSNLDAKLRLDMRAEIRRIVKQTGITAVYVTHDQKEALSMADGIAVMRAGKLQQTGTPTDLYRKPVSKFVADFIGESNFLPGEVDTITSSTVSVKTRAGTLFAMKSAAGAVSPRQKVLAAFRPEAVQVVPGDRDLGATVNQLRGRRVHTVYLGEIAEHIVEVDGQQIKAFELNPRSAAPAHGEEVVVAVRAEHVMLVPDAA